MGGWNRESGGGGGGTVWVACITIKENKTPQPQNQYMCAFSFYFVTLYIFSDHLVQRATPKQTHPTAVFNTLNLALSQLEV